MRRWRRGGGSDDAEPERFQMDYGPLVQQYFHTVEDMNGEPARVKELIGIQSGSTQVSKAYLRLSF